MDENWFTVWALQCEEIMVKYISTVHNALIVCSSSIDSQHYLGCVAIQGEVIGSD